jgi:pyrimidine-nucleoside phosphorylase
MSKKIAEGIDALVLDVKTGKGAVMANENDSAELADMLTGIGSKFSKRVFCFITNMDEPLGYAVGNWLEIVECIECLKGKDVPDLMELTYALGGAMVMLGNKAATIAEGVQKCKAAIRDGSAWNKFLAMVKAQGGDPISVSDLSLYPKSKYTREILATHGGWVKAIDALEIGLTSHSMGAGRVRADAGIDPKAGILLTKKIGDPVTTGELIATCYSDDQAAIEDGVTRAAKAFEYSTAPVPKSVLIRAQPDDHGRPRWV